VTKKKTQPKLRALAANVFAGGFSIGVRDHFDVIAHFEESDYGVATVQKNYPDLPIHYPNSEWPVDEPEFQELDFIYGNPPCAAWSVAGYTKTRGADKWRTDPRVQCTVRHFGLLEKLRPTVWATESVTQAYGKGQEVLRELEKKALELGYNVYYVLHDTKWHGVPQSRKRFFMVCSKVNIGWPLPNWAPPKTALECLQEVTPTRLDWTVKIEPLVAKWLQNTYFEMEPGEKVRDYWERFVPQDQWKRGEQGQIIGRPSFGHRRLPVDRPADAFVGYALIHPTEKRFVTVNEGAALCGFPPDYEFAATTPNAAFSLIARGVCPPCGSWLGGVVANAIRTGTKPERPGVFHVELREPPAEGHSYVHELPPARELVQHIPAARFEGAPRAKSQGVGGKRRVEVPVANLLVGAPIPEPDRKQGRMRYLQELISLDRFTADQLVAIIKHHWPESLVSKNDVATQRKNLKLLRGKDAVPEIRKFPAELLPFAVPKSIEAQMEEEADEETA
jgi:site-specific DNA-cytosine methylase